MHECSDCQLILINEECVILHNMLVEMPFSRELSDEVDENRVCQSEMELLQKFFTADIFESQQASSMNEPSNFGEHEANSTGKSNLL